MKHFLAALGLSLCVVAPAFADVSYDVNDVRNELAVHAYNYAGDLGKDATGFDFSRASSAESGCFGAIALGRRLGMSAKSEMEHRDFAKVPGARHDEDRDEWVITFEQGEQFCTALGKQIVTSAALGHFAELAKQATEHTYEKTVTLETYSAAMKEQSAQETRAQQCDSDVDSLKSSAADKQRAISVAGTSVTISNAKQTVCALFYANADDRKKAVAAFQTKFKADNEAAQKVEEAAAEKEYAAFVSQLKKLGASGEKLQYLLDWDQHDMRGPGGSWLSWKQQVKAAVIYNSWTNDSEGMIYVEKFVFRGPKLVSHTTISESMFRHGIDDSRLYR